MSSTSKPHTVRWGIIATGGISKTFTKDLLLDPSIRGVSDVFHVVTAVGSRSVSSAEAFIKECYSTLPEDSKLGHDASKVKACGSYQEVYDSPDVDIIYVGTPHTYHYENTKDALTAGKHVLCEKPFTFDLAELDELIALAREKKLFLMEAVWTRFHPLAYKIQELVFSEKYGKFKRMFADLSSDIKPDTKPLDHRMIDPALGGGPLLDLGPYPMVWTMLLVHEHPSNNPRKHPSTIKGHMKLYPKTGVDETSTWILEWDGVGEAICTASMTIQGSKEHSVIIQMETADVHLAWPTWGPESYIVYPKDESAGDKPVKHTFPIHHGRGMHYQADECARCLRDGKLESERCDLEESRVVMDVFDKVREQGGYVVKHGKATKP